MLGRAVEAMEAVVSEGAASKGNCRFGGVMAFARAIAMETQHTQAGLRLAYKKK